MINFSSSGHLMEKSTFLLKFQFFFFDRIKIFARKLILRETLVTLLQKFAQLDLILSLYLRIHSFAQKLTLFA